ncbi:histidine kinase [Sphingomicrobium sediminis]|uniref:Histidine kinase n=1 Tax=Sphingomicrobium sediminis TaxID=2950949 RepID=A0A9X2J1L3_9SPHN|nr:histidine kinase [Sphingomicrobium sediminis]MCM8556839.1 histidine kinase [Sphingomicrobium sediminis]
MLRWIVGIFAFVMFIAGSLMVFGVLGRSGDTAMAAAIPDPLPAEAAADAIRTLPVIPEIEEPPAADPLTKEQKRFNRVDKNKDEQISLSELVHPRRNRFANLDLDQDGQLSFEEWAITTIEKFEGADSDSNGILSRTEYATTAPKPRKPKPACSC